MPFWMLHSWRQQRKLISRTFRDKGLVLVLRLCKRPRHSIHHSVLFIHGGGTQHVYYYTTGKPAPMEVLIASHLDRGCDKTGACIPHSFHYIAYSQPYILRTSLWALHTKTENFPLSLEGRSQEHETVIVLTNNARNRAMMMMMMMNAFQNRKCHLHSRAAPKSVLTPRSSEIVIILRSPERSAFAEVIASSKVDARMQPLEGVRKNGFFCCMGGSERERVGFVK